MERLAPKTVAALDPRQCRRRKGSDRGDQKPGVEAAAVLESDAPAPRALIVSRGRHPAAKLDIAAQVELVSDMIEIAQRLRLASKVLRPFPFLQQLLRKRVTVGIALGIEARAGIAIPVPGAADVGPSLEHPHAKTLFAQPVELVQPRHARADDDGVVVRNRRRSRVCGLMQGYPVSCRWTNPAWTRGRVAGLPSAGLARLYSRPHLILSLGFRSPVKRRRQGREC
jgi:hypothetical protein